MKAKITKRTVDNLVAGEKDAILWDAGLTGFGLRARPGGGRAYFVKYAIQRRHRWVTIGKHGAPWTPETARREAKRILGEVAAGRDPAAEKAAARAVATLDHVAEQFIAKHASTKRTGGEMARTLRVYVLPTLGRRLITEIKRRDIIELLDQVVTERGPSMANGVLSVTRSLFGWALARDIVPASPVAGVKKPGAVNRGSRILDDDEIRAVWCAAEALGYPFGPLVQLLMVTGQRRGEVAGMRRSEISADGTLWTLPAARAKNGVAHEVPLSGLAQAIIASCPLLGDCVFSSGRIGDHPFYSHARGKSAIDARTGAFVETWTLHDLRRTLRTRLSGLGVAVDVAEKTIGHIPQDVRHVYDLHRYRDEKREALELWAGLLRDILDPSRKVVPLRQRGRSQAPEA